MHYITSFSFNTTTRSYHTFCWHLMCRTINCHQWFNYVLSSINNHNVKKTTQVLMEECVIIGQGQECSKDRFSQTKRALNVPGMAEPRGAGGQILSADLLTHLNQGGRLGPLHYYCVFTLQIFRPSAIPVYTESRIYLWNSVFWNRLEKRWRDNRKFLCFFLHINGLPHN